MGIYKTVLLYIALTGSMFFGFSAMIQSGNFAQAQVSEAFTLTLAERQWLEAHPDIRIAVMDAWPPVNFVDARGRPSGIGADYIDLLNQMLGNRLTPVPGPFKKSLDQVKNRVIDGLMDVTPKPEREAFLNFTRIYLDIPHVIVALKNTAYLKSEDDLGGKTLALEQGFYNITYFRKNWPKVKIREYPNTAMALDAVARGEADAYAGNRAVAAYLMEKEVQTNLGFHGRLGKPGSVLAIGVRKDWPVLADILDRAIAAIPAHKLQEIRRRWTGFTADPSQDFSLTARERAWIAHHPRIRVNSSDLPPFIIQGKPSQPSGISTDILERAAAKAGLTLEYVRGSWPQLMEKFRHRELDLLHCVSQTPERTAFMRFTAPYLTLSTAIYTAGQTRGIRSVADLDGRRAAVMGSTSLEKALASHHPGICLIPVETPQNGLQKVRAGEADAYIGNSLVVRSLIQDQPTDRFRLAGFWEGFSDGLRFGVHKDAAPLASILGKAMAAITPEQKQEIISRYVRLTGPAAPVSTAPLPGFKTLTVYAAIVLVAVGLAFFILLRITRQEKVAARFGSSWFRAMVVIGLSVFIMVVTGLGYLVTERNRQHVLRDEESHLRLMLGLIQDRTEMWQEERTALIRRLGQDPALVGITRQLLKTAPDQKRLARSQAQAAARAFFRRHTDIFPHIGFFIISPDRISIASMEDADIGTRNLIADQRPGLVDAAFAGKAGFVPPITWDAGPAGGKASGNGRTLPAMFFITPVQNMDGQIIAAMALRIDPAKDLARLTRSPGRWETDDIYVFDRTGRMLSPSRFESQLHQAGLLEKGQTSAMSLTLRDPGGNLLDGFRPSVDRAKMPLTRMARDATLLRRQMADLGLTAKTSAVEVDTRGYRDYRGVRVFGAWLWNRDLDMGLAAEIDEAEALEGIRQTRRTAYGVLGFTLLLSVFSVLLVLILGERTSRALARSRDTLEKKVMERTRELINNQRRFAGLLESAPDAMVVSDQAGTILLVNSQAEKLLGYHRSELLGNSVDILVPQPLRGAHPEKRQGFFKAAQTQGLGRASLALSAQAKDGTLIPVDINLSPIVSESGIQVVASIRDVTDRKKMEETLSRERARLQEILDTSPVGVAISAGKILRFANPKFLEMFDARIGQASAEFYVRPEEREWIVDTLSRGEKVELHEIKMRGRRGQVRDMLVTYLSVDYQGEQGLLGWLLDITDRKKAEQEIKDRFDELNRFRRLAVGRENRMIQLKKEINALYRQLGKAPAYKIVTTAQNLAPGMAKGDSHD